MTDSQPTRRKIQSIAIIACGGIGVGTGTGLMLGSPMYTMTLIEDRTFTRQCTHHLSENIDAIAAGMLGVALGGYVFQKSARWLYERIYR